MYVKCTYYFPLTIKGLNGWISRNHFFRSSRKLSVSRYSAVSKCIIMNFYNHRISTKAWKYRTRTLEALLWIWYLFFFTKWLVLITQNSLYKEMISIIMKYSLCIWIIISCMHAALNRFQPYAFCQNVILTLRSEHADACWCARDSSVLLLLLFYSCS